MSNNHQKNEEAARNYEVYKLKDPFPDIPPALLNSTDIKKYVEATGMISPFYPDSKHMKQASYAVRLLGRCIYWDKNGKKQDRIIKESEELVLEKNSIAFVSLEPRFRIPYYIALRFNLKIIHIHRGILLGTGPLVDPGFDGMLGIPLHNLTMNDYMLRGGDDLIWMEFTKINTYYRDDTAKDQAVADHNKSCLSDEYIAFRPDKNIKDVNDYLYKAYNGRPIRSSLSEIEKTAEEAETKASKIQFRGFISILAIVATLLGIVIALIYPAYQHVTDTNTYVNDAKARYTILHSKQSKRIELLEDRVRALSKAMEGLRKSSAKKAAKSNSSKTITTPQDATTKK